MARPTKIQNYLKIAKTVSERSTCMRRHYGAVIVSDDGIISTGYNGSARGEENCCDRGTCERMEKNVPAGERYELCLHGESKVKLLNGTSVKIEDLQKIGKNVWLYSIHPKTLKIIPAIGENIRITGYVKQMIEVSFAKSGKIVCTPDHQIMMRDGTYKQAIDLKPNDRVMPIYYSQRENAGLREHVSNGMMCCKNGRWDKLIYSPSTDWAANIVYEYFHPECIIDKDNFIHHKDGNSLNNYPDNLEIISRSKHTKLHGNFKNIPIETRRKSACKMHKIVKEKRKNPEYDKKFRQHTRELMKANWNNPVFVEEHIKRSKKSIKKTHSTSNHDPVDIVKRTTGKIIKGIYELGVKSGQDITIENYEQLKKQYKISCRLGDKGNRPPLVKTILKYFSSFEEAVSIAEKVNHKVESIRTIEYEKEIPIYCMTVNGPENFAVDLGDNSCIISHNCKSLHAENNAILEAGRSRCKGATLYLYGENVSLDDDEINIHPCAMCMRVIRQVGIKKIVMGTPEKYRILDYNSARRNFM